MKGLGIVIALLFVGGVQDSKFGRKPPAEEDPAPAQEEAPAKKDGPYADNLKRALEYCYTNVPKYDGHIVPPLLAGFAFLLEGSEKSKEGLDKCIQIAAMYKNRKGHHNHNWHLAYSALFLATVYWRDPRPEIKEALIEIAERAAETVEATGGWCHHQGMWKKSGYNRKGGGRDLGMLTAAMYTSLLMMKKLEIEVPEGLLEKARGNIDSLTRGGGIAYGTDNKSGDRSMARAAAAWTGCKLSGNTGLKLYESASSNLPKAVSKAERGHAWGALHVFHLSIALQLMGKGAEMGEYWLPKFASRQNSEGTLVMYNDGKKDDTYRKIVKVHRLGEAATFALLILLQNHTLYPRKAGSAKKKAPAGGGSKSPFGRKNE